MVKHKQIVGKDRTKSKTSNDFVYELLPEVKVLLLQLGVEQQENRKVFGRTWQDTGYIFVHPDGPPPPRLHHQGLPAGAAEQWSAAHAIS